jgi:hypothetical protein
MRKQWLAIADHNRVNDREIVVDQVKAGKCLGDTNTPVCRVGQSAPFMLCRDCDKACRSDWFCRFANAVGG